MRRWGDWRKLRDIGRIEETGTCICHNCSSNFRLRTGVAALNDDRDMLQEMHMVLRAAAACEIHAPLYRPSSRV